MFLLPRRGTNLDILDLYNVYAVGTRRLIPSFATTKIILQAYRVLIVKNTYVKLYLVSFPVVAHKV